MLTIFSKIKQSAAFVDFVDVILIYIIYLKRYNLNVQFNYNITEVNQLKTFISINSLFQYNSEVITHTYPPTCQNCCEKVGNLAAPV